MIGGGAWGRDSEWPHLCAPRLGHDAQQRESARFIVCHINTQSKSLRPSTSRQKAQVGASPDQLPDCIPCWLVRGAVRCRVAAAAAVVVLATTTVVFPSLTNCGSARRQRQRGGGGVAAGRRRLARRWLARRWLARTSVARLRSRAWPRRRRTARRGPTRSKPRGLSACVARTCAPKGSGKPLILFHVLL